LPTYEKGRGKVYRPAWTFNIEKTEKKKPPPLPSEGEEKKGRKTVVEISEKQKKVRIEKGKNIKKTFTLSKERRRPCGGGGLPPTRSPQGKGTQLISTRRVKEEETPRPYSIRKVWRLLR